MWKLTGSKDVFTSTYYPIRFNRKTLHLHVFRHNGKGSAHDSVGKSILLHRPRQGREKHLFELRCHALDENGLVIDTFGVGHDETSHGGVLELWEMIRLYMEEGLSPCLNTRVLSFPRVCHMEGKLVGNSAAVGRGQYADDDRHRAILGRWHGDALPDVEDMQGAHMAARGGGRLPARTG